MLKPIVFSKEGCKMIFVQDVVAIVREAGDQVLSHFRTDIKIYQKGDSVVTDVDKASEQFLKEKLAALLPGAGFLAEESGVAKGNAYTWVIDPLDGTRNFIHGLPYFCVTVALMQDQELIAAVTCAPFFNDVWYAVRGQGAWFNGKRCILAQKTDATRGLLLATSQSLLLGNHSLAGQIRCRVGGAAALDMAYVAAGIYDAVVFDTMHWWDIAAGVLLICEAGGIAMQHDGLPIRMGENTVLAGNKQVCELLAGHGFGKK